MPSRFRLGPLLAVVLTALLGAACGGGPSSSTATLAQEQPQGDADRPWRGVGLTQTVTMPDVTLTDTTGQPYDLRERTAGTPTLLFFGYTHCPDICPVHMANIARAMEVSGIQPATDIEVVFISADPERDTPERLGEFLGRFHEDFVGLTGSLEDIERAMGDLGLAPPVKEQELPDGGYTVGHPAQVIAFDASGESRMVYPFGVRQADWAHDLPQIAEGKPWPTVSSSP